MKMAVEGPELSSVPFDEILDIFKEQNRCILAVINTCINKYLQYLQLF